MRPRDGRKETVKAHYTAVRKASTKGPSRAVAPTVKLTEPPRTALSPLARRICMHAKNGEMMGVLAYIALTVAVFALLGLAQKLVERL